jgi:hypothetical protein
MGLKALHIFILLTLLLGSGSSFAQTQKFMVADQYDYRLFSPGYNYHDDILGDVAVGHFGAVWLARIYGQASHLETQNAEVGGLDFWVGGKYRLLESLEAVTLVRAKFEAGHTQDFFGDLEPYTGFLLREAAMRFHPGDIFALKAGVINQDWMGMPLLTFRKSFPGVQVSFNGAWTENFSSSLTGQYLIPTSQTLSTRTVGEEATPTFKTVTLGNSLKIDSLKLGADASYFKFDNLPSFVAFESQKRGNSYLLNNGPNNSAFQYAFEGWFIDLSAKYRINMFEPQIGFSLIKNPRAPDTYNTGSITSIGNVFHMDNHTFYIGAEKFFAESDVAPAYYNSWVYGNTNKKGYGLETWWWFKKQKFRIRAEYYSAKVLNDDGLQEDQQYFYLGVETGYDRI